MNRIDQRFQELRARGEKALIPFLMAGDPDLSTASELIMAFEEAGADLLEIGVPFSEPLADGPAIQRATHRALEKGTTPRGVLGFVERIRTRTRLPLILLSYVNPILRMGPGEFAKRAAGAGVDGVIIPDLPLEEAQGFEETWRAVGVHVIFLAAPTSTPERLDLIARHSRGYIYYVSLKGVTGIRERLADDLAVSLHRLRRLTGKPIAVGFGIGTPSQAAQVARLADGVIVGSAIVERIEKGMGHPGVVQGVAGFVRQLKEALASAAPTISH
jgi:tryptophan synthase alpha chain